MNLKGKKGIIFGLANDKSIAWGCAKSIKEMGGEFGLTFLNEALEKRVRPLAEEIGASFVVGCDLMKEEDVKVAFEKAKEAFGTIDFVVHSVAYADKEALKNPLYEVTYPQFSEAMGISAWTLLVACKYAKEILNPGGSIVTMTYYGSTKAIVNYGIMGVAKAALEAEVRYLANDLGEKEIRINAISAGPIRTLAASGIKGFKSFLEIASEKSCIKRPVTAEEVGQSCAYLLSSYSSGITGQTIFVDMGYSANA